MGSCMGCCVSSNKSSTSEPFMQLTPEEAAQRREAQASAAEARSKDFKQGGGGEKLKAKQRALENAEKKNSALGGGNAMDARQFD